MKINNDTELTIYEVKLIEWHTNIIIASSFKELSEDLIENCLEAEEIKTMGECYLSNWIINTIKDENT